MSCSTTFSAGDSDRCTWSWAPWSPGRVVGARRAGIYHANVIERSNGIESDPKPVRRRFRWMIGSAVAGLAAAVAVLCWQPWTGDVAGSPVEPVPLDGRQLCADLIKVDFGSDEDMRQAAEVLRVDTRTGRLFTETKQEAYVHFKEIFKDMPDLLADARPEALPASLQIVPRGQDDLHAWADELRARLPRATDVVANIRADLAAQLEAQGMEPPTPCPPSGEFPRN